MGIFSKTCQIAGLINANVCKTFYKPLVNRCDKSFILGEALTYHKKSEHSEEIKSLKCEYCQREFFTKGTKSVHEKLHFEAPKSQLYFCNLCLDGVTFSVSELIGHHQSFHEGLPLPYFQCEVCEFSSKKKMQTKQHMKNEHNVDEYYPYKCQQCDFKQYELSHGFTRHVQGMSL